MKYIVSKYNEVGKFWSVYETTYCMTDAYAILNALRNQGYQASTRSEVDDK